MAHAALGLPVLPLPLRREGPRHYLARLNIANGRWAYLINCVGGYEPRLFDRVRHLISDDQWEDIKSIAFYCNRVPTYWIRNFARVCPQCLAENQTENRLAWELPFADVCVHHHCWLIELCECGGRLNYDTILANRCLCGRLISKLRSVAAPQAVAHLTSVLTDAVLRIPKSRKAFPSRLSGGAFSHLYYDDLVRLIRMLGSFADPERPRQQMNSRFYSMAASWPISSVAAEVIHDWPHGFHRALATLNDPNNPNAARLTDIYGWLHLWIYRYLQGKQFDFVRAEFTEHLKKHGSPYVLRKNSFAARAADHYYRWITIAQAQKLLKMPRSMVMQLIQYRHLESVDRSTTRGRRFIYVNMESCFKYASRRCTYSTMQEATEKLGLKKHRLRTLLGRLIPDAWRTRSQWRIPEFRIEDLLSYTRSLRPITPVDDIHITFNQLMRSVKNTDLCIATLLDLDEKSEVIRPIGVCQSLHGVSGWVFQRSELWEYLQRTDPHARVLLAQGRTTRQLAEQWKVKEEVVCHFLNRGLLDSNKVNVVGFRGRIAPNAAIETFEMSYVLARELARTCDSSSAWLARQLRKFDIEPSIGRKTGCRQLLYRRSPELMRAMHAITKNLIREKREIAEDIARAFNPNQYLYLIGGSCHDSTISREHQTQLDATIQLVADGRNRGGAGYAESSQSTSTHAAL